VGKLVQKRKKTWKRPQTGGPGEDTGICNPGDSSEVSHGEVKKGKELTYGRAKDVAGARDNS